MKRGDVVLVHVPFVGAPGGKIRPALILQSDQLNSLLNETCIAEITSNTRHVQLPHQVSSDISTADGVATGLRADSAVRCERLHTIPQADVKRVIGQLAPQLMQHVEQAIKSALAIP